MKLNTLLAKTDHSASQFKQLISQYVAFFKGKQADFKGVKKTYAPKEGTADEPSLRGNVNIVTTVAEKLEWLEANSAEHIDNLFSVEATNASGNVKAALIVDGTDFGQLSSLELLRLKSLLETSDLEQMYANMPVRPDAENWEKTTEDQYKNRDVYETPQQGGVRRSIVKENYIMPDPNVVNLKDTSKYTPVVGTKDTVIELGDYTVQFFTGEYSHRQRADILARRSKLLSAVIEALKVANDKETVKSELTAKALFGYLHS